MKKNDVEAGKVYRVKVSGSVQDVRITGENPHGGWDGVNVATKRKVRIKSAQRLRAVAGERPAKRTKIVSLAEYEADAKGSAPAADVGPGAAKPAKATKDAKPAPKRDTGEPAAKGGRVPADGTKRMSLLDAAAHLLSLGTRDPMRCKDMVDLAVQRGLWAPRNGGKTPAATLHAAISREIKTKAEASRFVKADRGKFGLAEKA
jgi:hypothetical protein